MNEAKDQKHQGIERLREVLGRARAPGKSRKGALNHKDLARLAGIHENSMKALKQGVRSFAADTTFNRTIAENLTFTTGVDPSFRSDLSLRDIWGDEYTPESYVTWKRIGALADKPPVVHRRSGPVVPGNPTLSKEWRRQSKKLLPCTLDAARAKGLGFECMALRLIKSALEDVCEKMGILEEVSATKDKLLDFAILVGKALPFDEKKFFFAQLSTGWEAGNPALTIRAISPEVFAKAVPSLDRHFKKSKRPRRQSRKRSS